MMTKEKVIRELKFWFWLSSVMSIVLLLGSLVVIIYLASIGLKGLDFFILVSVTISLGAVFMVPLWYSASVLEKISGKKYG